MNIEEMAQQYNDEAERIKRRIDELTAERAALQQAHAISKRKDVAYGRRIMALEVLCSEARGTAGYLRKNYV